MQPGASGFTPKDLAEAREAAERFLQAVQRGDETTARALLIPLNKGEALDFKSMQESTLGYELGQAQAEGAQMIVEAKVRGAAAPGEADPGVQSLPLVLSQVDGAWKIDMGAIINRMLGVNLEEMMTQVAEGLGNAMAKGMEGIGNAMAKGMEAVAEGMAALSSPESGDQNFRDALDRARQTVLPDETAIMSEALGKELDVVVAWYSLGGSADAVDRMGPLVLGQLGEAIRRMCEDPEEREKLQGLLDRVVIRHVNRPEERVCVLDGGQLELAVCLTDSGPEASSGFYAADEISDVLRQAIQ